MNKDIKSLLKVQEKDIKINSLNKESQILPEELKAVKETVRDIENKVKVKTEEIKKLQVAHKGLEVDLETKQDNIKKCEIQLFQLKTNEEYKAMQKQINDLKFECGLIEDKILEKMEEIEKAQKGLKGIDDTLGSAKKTLQDKEKEISAKIKVIEEEVGKLEVERDILAQEVPPDFLSRYNLIFKNKQGAAIVAIENKACQGCHMALPPNVINEVRRGTQFIICDNCARILFYPNTNT